MFKLAIKDIRKFRCLYCSFLIQFKIFANAYIVDFQKVNLCRIMSRICPFLHKLLTINIYDLPNFCSTALNTFYKCYFLILSSTKNNAIYLYITQTGSIKNTVFLVVKPCRFVFQQQFSNIFISYCYLQGKLIVLNMTNMTES